MNKILACLDYNGTIDDTIPRFTRLEAEGNRGLPTFFRGLISLAVATKSEIEMAIISSASVDDIKDEINYINFYAQRYCKLIVPKDSCLIKYIVGSRSKELYSCEEDKTLQISNIDQTKKEGVEAVLGQYNKEDINLIVTGGDSQEDLEMLSADTQGIPNIFVAPKQNTRVDEYPDTVAFRDKKNRSGEGVGRCLTTISRNLEYFGIQDSFNFNTSTQMEQPLEQ